MSTYVKCLSCKQEIISLHRHDFRQCSCGKLAVDGGFDYLRILGEPESYEITRELAIEDYPWGTYGKDGKEPYREIKLGNADTDHLVAILTTQKQIHEKYKKAIQTILASRGVNLED